MPPPGRPREPSIERTPEYEQFIRNLADFHARRGTHLEPQPRVGTRHVDLFRLFNVVVSRGGYDVVSAQKLAWRKLGQDFNLGTSNLPALAFSLKSVYYKNLAAFEISTVHGREPPPREILEDISARGGNLLSRTLENFRPHGSRENGQMANGEETESSPVEEQRTPREDGGDTDDASGGSSMRRALRVAPPQRVPFQPDLTPSRQVRHPAANASPPQPVAVSTMNGLSLPPALANYEPRPPNPLTLRPVITPANNPTLFRERARASREAVDGRRGSSSTSNRGIILPGSEPRARRANLSDEMILTISTEGFEGPNVYVRALHALRSGIPQEQDYALHHLVRISYERGEKFKFDTFPNLAEGLIDKVLEVGSLFYHVNWRVSCDVYEISRDPQCLNGNDGTPDILQRIEASKPLQLESGLLTESFCHRLAKINEAGLVLRNMAMQEDNAEFLAQNPTVKDLLTIVLNLPRTPIVVELQHYALDIAEQLTRHFVLGPGDPLYASLLAHLKGDDRGKIINILRALTRISMDREEPNRLNGVPVLTLERICDWMMLDDEELVMACLEFLHQYTAFVDNIEAIVDKIRLDGLLTQLIRLLLHGAREVETKTLIKAAPAEPPKVELDNQEIMELPKDLLNSVLTQAEPERASLWLRALFDEDQESEITQINIWSAYQSQFSKASVGATILAAADFIKHITAVFPRTSAQVTHTTEAGSRFVIKGIRCRQAPKDPSGRVYQRCLWRVGQNNECGTFILEPKDLYEHIISTHLQVPKKDDGKWDLTVHPDRHYMCQWGQCGRYGTEGTNSPLDVGKHIKIHLPKTTCTDVPKREGREAHDRSGAEHQAHRWCVTAMDEQGHPTGLPMASVMVLKNLARSISKLEQPDGEASWMEKLFLPIEPRLWDVMAYNRTLFSKMTEVMQIVTSKRPRLTW